MAKTIDLTGLRVIPLSQIPNQRLQCVVNGQKLVITIAKRGERLYMDVNCNSNPVSNGVLCLCGNSLVPYRDVNFTGDLFFIDLQNHNAIPDYKQFNTRFQLVYLPKRWRE